MPLAMRSARRGRFVMRSAGGSRSAPRSRPAGAAFALARALQARGDAGSARLEAAAVRDVFDRLGAARDREACDRFLGPS